jgi:hypothetical protein
MSVGDIHKSKCYLCFSYIRANQRMVPGGTDTAGTGTCKVDSGAEHASYVGVPLVKTLLCNCLQSRGKQIKS